MKVEHHLDALAHDFILFCDDVQRIGAWRDLFAHGPPVSALTVSPSESSLDSIAEALKAVLLRRNGGSGELRFWIFLADGYWQDDTRLARYRKIWRYLDQQGIHWPDSLRGPEVEVRSTLGVRYVTTALVTHASFREATTMMFRQGSTTFMLISEEEFLSEASVLELFEAAFSASNNGYPETHLNWGRLIQRRASRGDVIIKRSGFFDALAWSIDLIAQPGIMKPFVDATEGNSREI